MNRGGIIILISYCFFGGHLCVGQAPGVQSETLTKSNDTFKNSDLAWRVGGLGEQVGVSVAVDHQGHIYVGGFFTETAVSGNIVFTSKGGADGFVAKYDTSGVLYWMQQIGGEKMDFVKSIAVDSVNNVYITGSFQGTATFGNTSLGSEGRQDGFVAKYNSAGTLQWARQLGRGGTDEGTSLNVGVNGNVLVAGNFGEESASGETILRFYDGSRAFVSKYDSTGKLAWSHEAQENEFSYGQSIATDRKGSIYLTGSFEKAIKFGDVVLAAKGDQDTFIAKYDSKGVVQWAERMGGEGGGHTNSIAVDGEGNVFLSGFLIGANPTFGEFKLTSKENMILGIIAKISTDGVLQWLKVPVKSNPGADRSICVDKSGNLFVAGAGYNGMKILDKSLVSKGENDIFVAKIDTNGNLLWTTVDGGINNESARAIALAPNGDIYVTGSFQGTTTLAGQTLTAKGKSDIFVVKYQNK